MHWRRSLRFGVTRAPVGSGAIGAVETGSAFAAAHSTPAARRGRVASASVVIRGGPDGGARSFLIEVEVEQEQGDRLILALVARGLRRGLLGGGRGGLGGTRGGGGRVGIRQGDGLDGLGRGRILVELDFEFVIVLDGEGLDHGGI